jgi:hypothetical protein
VGVEVQGRHVAFWPDPAGEPRGDASGTGAEIQAAPPTRNTKAGQYVQRVLIQNLA